VKFVKELWIASGQEFAKKIVREKLKEVCFMGFIEKLV
jgi:hypothetical protein